MPDTRFFDFLGPVTLGELAKKENLHDIVLVAIEQNWEAIRAHKDSIGNVLEVILRDGIAVGEFEPVDPRETVELITRSMLAFTHPVLIGKCLEEHQDLAAAVRQSVRYLLRAITPRS